MSAEFFATIEAFVTGLGIQAASGYAVFIRVGAAMALLPAFGETVISIRVRLALTFAFTFVVAPAVMPILPAFPTAPVPLFMLTGAEAVAGLAIGAGLRLFVLVLQIAGTIAAQSTSLAQFFGGAGVDPQPAMSQIMLMAGLALALMAGLHVRLAELLILSYTLFPPGQFPNPAALGEWGLSLTGRLFALAFSLAMPFVILSVVYSSALGAINKAMPQLMVAFVGAPAITFGGLALFMVVVPLALPIWLEAFHSFMSDPTEVGR